ncbi:hypothetical protein DU490_05190 [Halomonas sp. DQ26W]|nr:hypothetical protein DU490_05190 [Halomonas sp. DQ26W]
MPRRPPLSYLLAALVQLALLLWLALGAPADLIPGNHGGLGNQPCKTPRAVTGPGRFSAFLIGCSDDPFGSAYSACEAACGVWAACSRAIS